MTRSTLYIAILTLLLWPATVPAQSVGELDALVDRAAEAGIERTVVSDLVERARQRGLNPEETAQLVEPAVGLAEEGLPGTPAVEKALEGLAKGVPFSRIHPVVGQLETHTREVGTYVREWARQNDVRAMLSAETDGGGAGDAAAAEQAVSVVTESAAQARMQGAPMESIEGFLSELPARTSRRPIAAAEIANAVQVIPDVPGENGPPQGVGRLLTEALDGGLSAESVRQIPAALEEARRQTGRPVDALASGAAAQMASGTPASQVVQTLFAGGRPGTGPGGGPPEGLPPGEDVPPGPGNPDDGAGTAGQDDPGPPGGGSPGSDGPGNGPDGPDDTPGGGGGGTP